MTTKAVLTITVYQRGCDCVYVVTTKAVLRVTVYHRGSDCVYATTKAVLTVTVYQIGCDCVYDNKSCAYSHCASNRVILLMV